MRRLAPSNWGLSQVHLHLERSTVEVRREERDRGWRMKGKRVERRSVEGGG